MTYSSPLSPLPPSPLPPGPRQGSRQDQRQGPARRGPLPAGSPDDISRRARVELGPALPRYGVGQDLALESMARIASDLGIDLTHPFSAAHLQPPVLEVAVEADRLASASNASMDTYDSGPGMLDVERWVVEGMARLAGLPAGATGVMTPGGTMSNLLGLMLARDDRAARSGVDARHQGVSSMPRPTVLCSELAHFSVQRACAALGLGEHAVVTVPTDHHQRMRVDALRTALEQTPGTPVAIVATAGTTDFGSVDPLPEIADLARAHDVWLHVDAAYGFGALLSDRLAPMLDGIARADSLTLDLHKLGWVPAAASVLLVRDPRSFDSTQRTVDYLMSADDVDAGLEGLLGRSLQTTRRADALKVAATLQAYGTRGLGQMVERCHELTHAAAQAIDDDPDLELMSAPILTTVLFRCRTTGNDPDVLQARVRRELLTSGQALIGRTTVRAAAGPAVVLKLTLLNPSTDASQVRQLVGLVSRTARAIDSDLACEVLA